MGDIITVQQRNIEELGFPEELHNKADGLFLDLPGPWHVSWLSASFSLNFALTAHFQNLSTCGRQLSMATVCLIICTEATCSARHCHRHSGICIHKAVDELCKQDFDALFAA